MGYVYSFRHGHEDEFKFGRTSNLERRRKSLQTGCPKPLTVFDFIETEDAKEGEKFVLDRLAHRRLTGEFCAVTAEEATEAMTACRVYLERELPRLREQAQQITELSAIESGEEMLPSSQEVLGMYRQLLRLRAEKRLRTIELGRIEAEEGRLEATIKLAIGSAKGIEGVATWETGNSRRAFNANVLKTTNPELYEMYSTAFDRARFRIERPEEYASCQQTKRVRQFRLVEDS